jgi:hypothetical protein
LDVPAARVRQDLTALYRRVVLAAELVPAAQLSSLRRDESATGEIMCRHILNPRTRRGHARGARAWIDPCYREPGGMEREGKDRLNVPFELARSQRPRERFRNPRSRAEALAEIKSDYLELPGLMLNAAQAARLWSLPLDECTALLDELVRRGVLVRTGDQYGRRSAAGSPPAKQLQRQGIASDDPAHEDAELGREV